MEGTEDDEEEEQEEAEEGKEGEEEEEQEEAEEGREVSKTPEPAKHNLYFCPNLPLQDTVICINNLLVLASHHTGRTKCSVELVKNYLMIRTTSQHHIILDTNYKLFCFLATMK